MAIILLGLLTGFLKAFTLAGAGGRFRSFGGMIADLWRWQNSRLIAITLLTLVFPVSLAFRLTVKGWELGSRLGALSFIGVALVVAIAFLCRRSGKPPGRVWAVTIAACVTLVAMGGFIVGWGVVNLPSGYRVAGDALSVERTGIDAARWTRTGLGSGHRFGADRINRLLLATYGDQRIVTTLLHRVDMSRTMFASGLGSSERYDLRAGRVDYLLVDMRMTLEKPLMGVYFEKGEPDWVSANPPSPQALLKFDALPRASRLYDSGAIKIYDVRAFRNADERP